LVGKTKKIPRFIFMFYGIKNCDLAISIEAPLARIANKSARNAKKALAGLFAEELPIRT
jgi:hypothetical protein